MGQQIFAAADCRPNKKPNPIMAEELACSMCFIVKQQSLDIISDVGEPEGAVPDHFVIKRHHNGRAAEAVEALVWGVLDLCPGASCLQQQELRHGLLQGAWTSKGCPRTCLAGTE